MIKKRELAAVVMLVVAIVGVVVFYLISLAKQTFFSQPNPLEYIIQCATLQAQGSQSRLFQIKVHENIINCHALLWKIPPTYSAEKSATDATYDQAVIQEITIRASFTNDGKLIPYDKSIEVGVPFSPDITIKPSWASFETIVS